MRVTRAKQYRRYLRFFRIVYGIAPPYKVILDGNFIHCCISSNVDIQQRIASVLQGAKLQLYVPRAAREELKALGAKFEKAYKFAIGRCRALPSTAAPAAADSGDDGKSPGAPSSGVGRERRAVVDPAGEIQAAIGSDNAGKYMVASQDEDLRSQLRRVPGCPLIYVSRTVLLMEQPSGKSKTEFEKAERKKVMGTTEEETRVLDAIKRKEREEREKERLSQPRKRLKKRASAPNPLSCKKAKLVKDSGGAGAKSAAGAAAARDGRKRLRRKKKSLAAGSDGGGGGGGGSVGGGSVAGAGERLGVSGADV